MSIPYYNNVYPNFTFTPFIDNAYIKVNNEQSRRSVKLNRSSFEKFEIKTKSLIKVKQMKMKTINHFIRHSQQTKTKSFRLFLLKENLIKMKLIHTCYYFIKTNKVKTKSSNDRNKINNKFLHPLANGG